MMVQVVDDSRYRQMLKATSEAHGNLIYIERVYDAKGDNDRFYLRGTWPNVAEGDIETLLVTIGPQCWWDGRKLTLDLANAYAEYVLIDAEVDPVGATVRLARLYARAKGRFG